MLSPAGFSCAETPVEFMARMIFTKEGQCRILRKEMPAILHSRWRSPAGADALILVNWTSKPQAWSFRRLSGTLPAHTCEKRLLAPPQG